MKKYVKKLAACVIMGTLSLSLLAGCGKKIDKEAVVATVDGEKVPMGVVSFLARYQQVKVGSMYTGMLGYSSNDFWDNVEDEESGETYGDTTVKDVAEQVAQMYVLRAKAPEYNVTVTDEEKQKIKDAAAAFVEANGDEILEKIGTSQEDIETFLELSTYQKKIHDEIVKDVDTNVTDEEAQQTTITYSKVSYEADADDETKNAQKEKAQQILDEVLATADADMKEIAQGVDEETKTINIHFSTNDPEDDTVDEILRNAVNGLKDGEVNSSLIEGEDCYYVVRLDKTFDQEATETKKKSIVNDREQELYDETTQKWFDAASIEEDEKVLKTLKITAKDAYEEKRAGTTAEEEAAPVETETPSQEETEGAQETPQETPAEEAAE
ncbi:MAG: FKBP-type peptidylprolyl isomerase [Blautia sp.]|jgi:foldase protein PrsA